MRVLITGGAGFVGSNLAFLFKKYIPATEVTVFDNLHRRGSELNLPKLRAAGIDFVHGDIRSHSDLEDINKNFDLFIEASAEPSVQAGLDGSPAYVLQTNLSGTLNCLEFARRHADTFIFLSSSRVYSIVPLKEIALEETPSRFEIAKNQKLVGVSDQGISEEFQTSLPRSFYGATKLASELIVQEYAETYGLKTAINRCGVIAGPGQFGKADQGVFTLWVAQHYFKQELKYTGFGGHGKQVRDLLHPEDLFTLIQKQIVGLEPKSCNVWNVGGGRPISTSMRELTTLCRAVTGNEIAIASDLTTSPVDIPLYISDSQRVSQRYDWTPERRVQKIVEDIYHWIKANERELIPLFKKI